MIVHPPEKSGYDRRNGTAAPLTVPFLINEQGEMMFVPEEGKEFRV